MVPPISPAIWPNGSTAGASSIFGGAPYHPQTQGKIERWHQTLKNRVLLENYYLPGALEAEVGAFVDQPGGPWSEIAALAQLQALRPRSTQYLAESGPRR